MTFTSNLAHHIDCSPREGQGNSLRSVLDYVLNQQPELKSYILDDQNRLRKHVTVFVDEKPIHDRENLSDPVGGDSEVFVLQALSGG